MNVEQFVEHGARSGHVAPASDISLCFEHAFQKFVILSVPAVHVSLFGPRLFHALVTIRVEASLLQIASASYKRSQRSNVDSRGTTVRQLQPTISNFFVVADFSFKKERVDSKKGRTKWWKQKGERESKSKEEKENKANMRRR